MGVLHLCARTSLGTVGLPSFVSAFHINNSEIVRAVDNPTPRV